MIFKAEELDWCDYAQLIVSSDGATIESEYLDGDDALVMAENLEIAAEKLRVFYKKYNHIPS